MLTRRHRAWSLVVVAGLAATGVSKAAVTADQVVSFVQGTGAKTGPSGEVLDVLSSALGLPSSNHSVSGSYEFGGQTYTFSDTSALTPFSAAYGVDEIVSIGAGGSVVLHMSGPVPTSGRTLGVHTGSGLIDTQYPNGVNAPTAGTYTDPRVAVVDVSADGSNWFTLGSQEMDVPSNYYSAGLTNPYQNGPGSAVADFAKPFLGTLSSFDGKDWQGTLGALDGSGGGTWLDLSAASGGVGSLPAQIQFVRFSVPAGSTDSFVLDSLVAVPEPASLGLIVGVGLIVTGRRGGNRS